MKCPKCSSKAFVKAGFVRKKQRFLCKNCGCQFTQDFVGKYGQNIKLQALKLYKEGNGFRRLRSAKIKLKNLNLFSIGRILGVSFEIVRLWILNFGQYFKPNLQEKNYDIIEVDELCTFLKNESKNDGSGLLIIVIQGKYLISKLDVEDTKQQKNSLQG